MDYVEEGPQPPEPWETGWKDTVMASPEYITRIIATFDLPGLYVWHCHIVEHEDMDMMRPFFVGPMP
jgi:FtsP/CotA-like multicopper oxidase with cupredoxin domain